MYSFKIFITCITWNYYIEDFKSALHTSAHRGRTAPLRGMSREAVDRRLTLKLIAFTACETQSVSCLEESLLCTLDGRGWGARVTAGFVSLS